MAKVHCSCVHPEQDKLHGKNIRVANVTQKKSSPSTVEARCTVCGKIHTISTEQAKK